jgi:23S rRNA pseudouridine2457 synthase
VKHYILFYKPYLVLCQFSDTEGRKTIADFGPFPKDVYPAGRLDYDSEGLVLLTNDGSLKHLLLEPKHAHPRTYLAQVERVPNAEAIERLKKGVVIEGKKTLPCEAKLLKEEPDLPPRSTPIRFRKNIPTSWVELTLREGRNRQVRKMTAAVGHPTLRLVRTKIGPYTLAGLIPGQSKPVTLESL